MLYRKFQLQVMLLLLLCQCTAEAIVTGQGTFIINRLNNGQPILTKAMFDDSGASDYEGENINGDTVQFESYGLISLVPKDASGNTLNFTDSSTVALTFDAVASLDEQIVPMWYYDNTQNKWIEEGYAQRQEDGTYRGEISHPGSWSLSKPLEAAPGIYRGRIVYEDGTPAQDVRIHAVGSNWSSSDLSTDENGLFEIEVVPGSSFQLVAYNYKDKYEAMYNSTIAAIASGDIVEDRI